MARDITSGFQTQIEARYLRPLLLVKAEFDGGDVRFFTGQGSIDYDGETYIGAGDVLNISPVEETSDITATNVTFTLSGLNNTTTSLALEDEYRGKPITLWFGVLDGSGSLDAYQIYKGKMDVIEFQDDGEKATFVLSTESDLLTLKSAVDRNYTPEDQKAFYPDDKGLDFIPKIQDIEIVWGS